MTEPQDSGQNQTVFTDADRNRLRRTLGKVPYSGTLVRRWDESTVDSLIAWLEELSAYLRVVGDEKQRDEAQLDEYRSMFRGGAKLLQTLLATETTP